MAFESRRKRIQEHDGLEDKSEGGRKLSPQKVSDVMMQALPSIKEKCGDGSDGRVVVEFFIDKDGKVMDARGIDGN